MVVPLVLTLVLPVVGLSARGIMRTTVFILILQVAFMLIDVFMEEMTYRGIILQALGRYGLLFQVAGSSVLFGLGHADNLFLPGADELGVCYQMFEASLVGVLFAAVRLSMNAIWPVIVIHAVYDLISCSPSGMPTRWRQPCRDSPSIHL
jgi:membrane protease YdiL (CAAX protease family)